MAVRPAPTFTEVQSEDWHNPAGRLEVFYTTATLAANTYITWAYPPFGGTKLKFFEASVSYGSTGGGWTAGYGAASFMSNMTINTSTSPANYVEFISNNAKGYSRTVNIRMVGVRDA